jgi:hypothetical protein
VKAMVSAAGKKMPVLVSPVVVIDGADTVPAANSMVCAPPVTTTVPVEVGRVSVGELLLLGAAMVNVPDPREFPSNAIFDMATPLALPWAPAALPVP